MNRRRLPVPSIIILLWVLSASSAATATTRPGVIYLHDYPGDELLGEQFAPAVAATGAQVLHVGRDLPMLQGWGPVAFMDFTDGRPFPSPQAARRLTPEEVRQRTAALQAAVRRIHRAGVPLVIPYVSAIVLGGDPESRSGFWEFYDHWDDYQSFGIGPRPVEDPLEWLQRTSDGRPRVQRSSASWSVAPPGTQVRYAACLNSTSWRQWAAAVARLAAQCGYDGLFVDNCSLQQCYCDRCQQGFRRFLARRYTTEEAGRLLGGGAPGRLRLGTAGDGLLWVETQRFWAQSLADYIRTVRDAGAQPRGGRFFLCVNTGKPWLVKAAFRDCDLAMYEHGRTPPGPYPGLELSHWLGVIPRCRYRNYILQHLVVQALHGHVRSLVYTKESASAPGGANLGRPVRGPTAGAVAVVPLAQPPEVIELGLAEAAAFSGGGAFECPQVRLPTGYQFAGVMRHLGDFVQQHQRLYQNLRPWAQVGVLAFVDQSLLGRTDHEALLAELTEALGQAHVPFSLITEEQCRLRDLESFSVVLVPAVACLSEPQAQALSAYASHGGHVLFLGGWPVLDDRLRARDWMRYFGALPGVRGPGWGSRLLATFARLGRGRGRRAVAWWALRRLPALLHRQYGVEPLLVDHTGRDSKGVRLAAYETADRHRMVVHIVNYNVLAGAQANPVRTVNGMRLSLPFPPVLDTARLFCPRWSSSRDLAIRRGVRRAEADLPPLDSPYFVVELEFRGHPR